MNSKKAQIEITFNWIYILIAGVIILLFFVGLVVKQKEVSETNLANDIVRILESILTAASVSENTKFPIDASALRGSTFYFDCYDGVTEFGLKDSSARPVQDSVQPIFSPEELDASKMITWSMPYKLPFKVADLLFLTSENTKYYFIGGNRVGGNAVNNEFIDEFVDAASCEDCKVNINFDVLAGRDEYDVLDLGGNHQVKFIAFDYTIISNGNPVPEKINNMRDNLVTAIVFNGDKVDFFQMKDGLWKKSPDTVPLVSLGGERDAAKYAAVFAGNEQIYRCNMKKSFRRTKFVNQVYQGKLGRLVEIYNSADFVDTDQNKDVCLGSLRDYSNNLQSTLTTYQVIIKNCLIDPSFVSCTNLVPLARKIENLNDLSPLSLQKSNCYTLY